MLKADSRLRQMQSLQYHIARLATGSSVMLDEMRTFVVLAESGSLQRAAERLFLTPSAVTRQIQRLEAALKTPLLDRRVKPGRITREGRAVLDARATDAAHHGRSQGERREGRRAKRNLPRRIVACARATEPRRVDPALDESLPPASTGAEHRSQATAHRAGAHRRTRCGTGVPLG